jgi:hypothetical protein
MLGALPTHPWHSPRVWRVISCWRLLLRLRAERAGTAEGAGTVSRRFQNASTTLGERCGLRRTSVETTRPGKRQQLNGLAPEVVCQQHVGKTCAFEFSRRLCRQTGQLPPPPPTSMIFLGISSISPPGPPPPTFLQATTISHLARSRHQACLTDQLQPAGALGWRDRRLRLRTSPARKRWWRMPVRLDLCRRRRQSPHSSPLTRSRRCRAYALPLHEPPYDRSGLLGASQSSACHSRETTAQSCDEPRPPASSRG